MYTENKVTLCIYGRVRVRFPSLCAKSCLTESRSQNQFADKRDSLTPWCWTHEAYFGIPGGAVGSAEWPEGLGMVQHLCLTPVTCAQRG